ncbi:outer membrane protein [Paraburkholderia youngii]|uniref:OmpW/AlkL family protein n=1 Tax=Paraburkholderia youngii TaxID=2782701 RepID=UPI003D1E4D77
MRRGHFIAVASVVVASASAHAQSAGSNVVGAGWLRLAPQTSSDPLEVGGQAVPNTGASVDNADTVGITFTHFFTDNIALETVLGIPPKFKFYGTGALEAPSINPLGDVRQWSPTLVLKYYFLSAQSRWRPYAGLGVSYIWFTNAHVSPAFQQSLSQQFTNGQSASLPTSAHVDSEWSPVFNAGVTLNFSEHWSGVLSFSYLPFGTKANLTTTLPHGGTVHSVAKVTLDPLVTLVSVNYRF